MANILMCISNDDTQNNPFVVYNYREWNFLNTELNELTDKNSIKVPKVVETTKEENVIFLNFGY